MCQKLLDDGYFVVANYRNEDTAARWHEKNLELGYDCAMVRGCNFLMKLEKWCDL